MFREVEFFRRLPSDSGEVKNFPARFNPTRTVDWTRRTFAEDRRVNFLPFLFFFQFEVGVFYPILSYGVEIFVEIKVNLEFEK